MDEESASNAGVGGGGGGGAAAASRRQWIMSTRWTLCIAVVVLVMVVTGDAVPLARRGGRSRRAVTGDKELLYLMKFGYLPQSDLETGNLRTEDQLQSAIKELQEFANLPATGQMDEATRALLKRPRCGLPDVEHRNRRNRRYALQGRRWDYTNLTWSLQTLYPRNLDPRLVRQQLSNALDVWAQNSKLTFTQVDSKRADILIYFERGYHGDGYPFDGRGQILAHAFFPGDGRGGDAHFDEEENWLLNVVTDESEGTSLFTVAAHEFGHSLGLSHSSVPGALMYPWYQGIKPNFQLPDDDRHGIQQLYGAKDDRKIWGTRITSRPRPPPPPTTTTSTTTTTTPRPWTYYPRRTWRPDLVTPRPTPRHKQRPKEEEAKPNTCDTSYDAISVIRREVFIFKGKYMWRIDIHDGLAKDYPAKISRLWNSFPKNFTHVDAVYERKDKKIVFFIGKQYFLFHGTTLQNDYPRPLTHLGLPDTIEKLDAAMVWGYNNKTYFFSGTMYWRFDEEEGKVELDYPRDMSMWRGVGYNIDTVFQWKDGRTYFFKGKGYWKFNDLHMRVENEKQLPSAPKWMGCSEQLQGSEEQGIYQLDRSGLKDESEWNDTSSRSSRHGVGAVAGIFLITYVVQLFRI